MIISWYITAIHVKNTVPYQKLETDAGVVNDKKVCHGLLGKAQRPTRFARVSVSSHGTFFLLAFLGTTSKLPTLSSILRWKKACALAGWDPLDTTG